MASINQIVSEFAHSLGQPNNFALRENIRSLVVHTRNELIRHSYERHSFLDRNLTQRFVVSIQNVKDGEIQAVDSSVPDYQIINDAINASLDIKRTSQKVPKPTRLTNNLPFLRVSSVGFNTNREFPFIKETSARFRSCVPGLCGFPCYDYINGYIYIFPINNTPINLDKICIEAAFEHPTEIELANGEASNDMLQLFDNEWLISEDMIGQLKDIINKRDLLSNIRQTNEVPNVIKYN